MWMQVSKSFGNYVVPSDIVHQTQWGVRAKCRSKTYRIRLNQVNLILLELMLVLYADLAKVEYPLLI